ncbi:lysine--tRNA ligase [Buchnera aphidicola]|uniref:lysine--tRNA ligase n=1 Tax=Buchnera aphidicola TaxID=9 RepID=UPI0030EE120D
MKNFKIKINTEQKNRKKKLKILKKNGFNFPNICKQKNCLKSLQKKYKLITRNILEKLKIIVNIYGRIIKKRIMGKSIFFVIQDMKGNIQIYLKKNSSDIKKKLFRLKIKKLDLGDIIKVNGILFKTKTNELTVRCQKISLLTKSLRSLPEKFHGLSDKEKKYRQRYLEFISNKNSKKIFYIRIKIINLIRKFMKKKKFLEVETPMMHNIPGGAIAKPFVTYHNALNLNLYLRIAPELYLKRLIIGGFEKIFEINRNFRNEGISTKHNPEFTMMEIYIAYKNYAYIIKFLKKLIKYIIKKIKNNKNYIFIKNIINFKTLTMKQSILKYNKNIKKKDLKNFKKIKEIAKILKIKILKTWKIGHIINEIFEKTVIKKLFNPTFITEYPTEVSPLAKKTIKNENFTERFELFVSGYEIANGFSELNDPIEQKKRFINQIKNSNEKKKKYNFYDDDYIKALEYGMPPTAGLGIGIDRLIMILTQQKNIRDVILFPTNKPKS